MSEVVISSSDLQASYLGTDYDTGVTRIDLSAVALSGIKSIRIEDDNLISGGTGIASGYDLDFVKFSNQYESYPSYASSLTATYAIDFNSASFKAGYMQPISYGQEEWSGTHLYGTGTDGSVQINESNFGVKDGSNGTGYGSLSLGEGGTISFNLSETVTPTTGLYLYIGDVGGGNDGFRLVLSDQSIGKVDKSVSLEGDNEDNVIRLGEDININVGKGNDIINGYDGNDELFAASGNDYLIGGVGDDTLDGGAGNDTLKGDQGSDVLTGGSGKDVFVFDTKMNSSTNVDTITDFTSLSDKIQLENAVFSKLSYMGTLKAGNFLASATGNAADKNDYVLYNTSTGVVSYDADGSGVGSAVEIMILGTTTHPTIQAKDFFII